MFKTVCNLQNHIEVKKQPDLKKRNDNTFNRTNQKREIRNYQQNRLIFYFSNIQ